MADKRFPASLNCKHRVTLVNLMGRVPVGGGSVVIGADEDKNLRDLAGAIDYYAAQPGGCDSPAFPVKVEPEFKNGEGRRVFMCSDSVITAFPFTIAAGPYSKPEGNADCAEFGGPPAARIAKISRTAGDLDPPQSAGKETLILFNANELGAGLWYYNVRLDPGNGQSQSGFSVTFPVNA